MTATRKIVSVKEQLVLVIREKVGRWWRAVAAAEAGAGSVGLEGLAAAARCLAELVALGVPRVVLLAPAVVLTQVPVVESNVVPAPHTRKSQVTVTLASHPGFV